MAVSRGGPMRRGADERVNWRASVPFLFVNLSPVLVLVTGVSARAVILMMVTYWGRMWCITAGYHRYFAHRGYRLARAPQFLLAFGGTTAVQKGPLWWAGHHRDHHRFSDGERDVHSPQKGLWWSHMGWILCDKFSATPTDRIRDFAAFPELRFLDRHDWIGPWVLAVVCFALAGVQGLVLGFLASTVLLWHSTFAINSLAHVFGRRRYVTDDTSRNSFLLAVLTLGEGWHNNHHFHPSSARNGFFWWEWDPTWYSLRALSWIGVVRDLKVPSARRLASARVADGNLDIGVFRAHCTRAGQTLARSGDLSAHAPGRQGHEVIETHLQASLQAAEELVASSRRVARAQAVLR